jgi:hypothetical protein
MSYEHLTQWSEMKDKTKTKPPQATLRRFILLRVEDVSGSSGTGVVARGVQWVCGKQEQVVLFFADSFKVFPDMETMERIHSHEGRTRFHWQDKV